MEKEEFAIGASRDDVAMGHVCIVPVELVEVVHTAVLWQPKRRDTQILIHPYQELPIMLAGGLLYVKDSVMNTDANFSNITH